MTRWHSFTLAIRLLILLSVLNCFTAASESQLTEPILSVNQNPVSPADYLFFMQQQRASVLSAYPGQSAAQFKEKLIASTIKRVAREYVRIQSFKSLGLTTFKTPGEVLAELESVNRAREQSVAKGQVIYGPVHFSPLQYYEDWATKLDIKAKERLATDQLKMSTKEVKAFHKKNRKLFRSTPSSDWEIVSAHPAGELPVEWQKEVLTVVCSQMEKNTNSDQTFKDLEKQLKIKLSAEQHSKIDDARLSELIPDEADFAGAKQLKAGQVLRLKSPKDEIRLARCTRRVLDKPLNYKQCEQQVRRKLLDQKYSDYLDALSRGAIVSSNLPALQELINR